MFVIYNKAFKKYLKHPNKDIWTLDNLYDAKELLTISQEISKQSNTPEIADCLEILEIDENGLNSIILS